MKSDTRMASRPSSGELRRSKPRSRPDPGSSNETLGQRIRAIRIAWGWAQTRMANALGVDQATISFWEQDKIRPSGTGLLALSGLLRASLETLETGNGFVIPDAPEPQAGAGHARLRSVVLPVIGTSSTAVVNLTDGKCQGEDLSQTVVDLAEALKTERKVWIVVQ